MLRFTMSWGGNTTLTFCVLERDKKFCSDYLTTMLPQDIWPLLQHGYHTVETEGEFERLWEFLQLHLKGFTFPKPDKISVHMKNI